MPEFSAAQEQLVDDFVDGLAEGGPRGLWLYGPRQSGTTTLAYTVTQHVYDADAFDPEMLPGNRINAVTLADLQRKVWSAEELLRANGSDIAVWQELQVVLGKWDAVWEANVLLLDDLITVDVEFWKKHLLPRLDARLKGRGVTVIAGVVSPALFGSDWATGFSKLCKVARMGERGEG